MTIQEWQQTVDQWIVDYGIRYFDERTNALLLTEEVGEFCRLIARTYGEQSFKKETSEAEAKKAIAEELSDVIFVLTCLANQMDINLTEVLQRNIDKKTSRDHSRHHNNPKLKADE